MKSSTIGVNSKKWGKQIGTLTMLMHIFTTPANIFQPPPKLLGGTRRGDERTEGSPDSECI